MQLYQHLLAGQGLVADTATAISVHAAASRAARTRREINVYYIELRLNSEH
jgi:hypothetical protein